MTRFPILHILASVLRPFAFQFALETPKLPKSPNSNYLKLTIRLVSGRKFSGPGRARPKEFPKKSARARPGQNLLFKKSARAETGRKNYGPGQKGPNFFGEYMSKRAQKIDKCHRYLLKPYYLRSHVGDKVNVSTVFNKIISRNLIF